MQRPTRDPVRERTEMDSRMMEMDTWASSFKDTTKSRHRMEISRYVPPASLYTTYYSGATVSRLGRSLNKYRNFDRAGDLIGEQERHEVSQEQTRGGRASHFVVARSLNFDSLFVVCYRVMSFREDLRCLKKKYAGWLDIGLVGIIAARRLPCGD